MIAHFADLQLGYHFGPNGKSQLRQQDVYSCFQAMIQEIITRQCTTVLFVGDVFHFASPSRADLLIFQSGLIRLSDALPSTANIIVVSGNHDTPKSQTDIHPLRLFEHIKNVFCVWGEPMCVATNDGLVYAIPWVWGEPLGELLIDDAYILAVHAPILECLPEAARAAQVRFFNPTIAEQFYYVALGDIHTRYVGGTSENIVFPGSLEHTSFGEAQAICGGVFVNLPTSQGAAVELNWWDSPARPMHLLDLDLTGKEDPQSMIQSGLRQVIDSANPALVRVTIAGVDPASIDIGKLATDFPTVKLKWVDRPAPPVLSNFTPGEVDKTWMTFAKKNHLSSEVQQLGSSALQAVILKQ